MKALLMSRKRQFTIYIIACFFPVVSQLTINYAIAVLIGTATEGELKTFWKALLFSFIAVAVVSLLYVFFRLMRIGFIRDIILDVRKLAFEKIQSLSFEGFNKKSKATYMSNLINDINLFEEHFFLKLINIIFWCAYESSDFYDYISQWMYLAIRRVASFV